MRLVLLLGLVAFAAFAEAPSPGVTPAPEPASLPEVVDPSALVPPVADAPRLEPAVPGATKPEPPAEDLDFGWMLLRTVAVLGLVIMIAWFTLNFGLRKLMGLKPVMPGASVVQVLERVPLDSKHAMFVVKAAGEYLLIGGGEGNLQLISKLSGEDVEKLRGQPKPSLIVSPLLQRLLSRRDPPPPAKTGSNG